MEQERQKRNQLSVRQKPISEILKSGSQTALIKHLRQIRLDDLPRLRSKLKDLSYTLDSLRKQWIEEPDRRDEIELLASDIQAIMIRTEARLPQTIEQMEQEGEGVAAIYIESMIVGLVEWLNISNNMTPNQIQMTAELLTATFPHLTLEHFAEIFQRARMGKWGEIYNRLDGQVITSWTEQYIEELRKTAEDRYRESHLSTKESRANTGDTYRLRDIITKMNNE